jgi:hypothetical protein
MKGVRIVTAIFKSLFPLLFIAGYGILGIILLSRVFYSVMVELVQVWRTNRLASEKSLQHESSRASWTVRESGGPKHVIVRSRAYHSSANFDP